MKIKDFSAYTIGLRPKQAREMLDKVVDLVGRYQQTPFMPPDVSDKEVEDLPD